MIDHKKLAVIHIVKRELGLSDEEYRNILHTAAGVQSAKDLDEAVLIATHRLNEAMPGTDADVMLSPACASFDMFASYRHRGEAFAAPERAAFSPSTTNSLLPSTRVE